MDKKIYAEYSVKYRCKMQGNSQIAHNIDLGDNQHLKKMPLQEQQEMM